MIALYPCNYKKKGTIIWHCKCDCGSECDVDGDSLRRKITRSCGCISSSIGEMNIKKILEENNIIYKKEYTVPKLGKMRYDFAIFNND
mgnify:CR=1 FL=1